MITCTKLTRHRDRERTKTRGQQEIENMVAALPDQANPRLTYRRSCKSPASIEVPPMKAGISSGTARPDDVEDAALPLVDGVVPDVPGIAWLPAHVILPLTTCCPEVPRLLILVQSKLAEVWTFIAPPTFLSLGSFTLTNVSLGVDRTGAIFTSRSCR